MNAKTWLVIGATLGALGVVAGTFGAHLLPKYLEAAGAGAAQVERLHWWETGVRYQMYHALALLAVAWVAERRKSLLPNLAGLSMFGGIIIFSGCMYALGLTGVRAIGAFAPPIGGSLFIAGWVLLAISGRGLVDESREKECTAREKLLRESSLASKEESTEEQSASSEG